MSSFDYTRMATVAETLLTKFGQSMTLTHVTEGGRYDPHTGESVQTETQETVIGVLLPTGSSRVRGGEGAIGDFDDSTVGLTSDRRRFAVIKAKSVATAPKPADRVAANGTSYRVTGVTPINPAGVAIVYQVGLEEA